MAGSLRIGSQKVCPAVETIDQDVIILREVSPQGKFQKPTSSFTFSLPNTATDADKNALYCAFENCTTLTSVDLSNLTTVSGAGALMWAFGNCTNLTSINLRNLTSVSGNTAFYGAFYGCSIVSLDLPNLTSIGPSGFNTTFSSCPNLTSVNLSSLTTLSGSFSLIRAFSLCPNLSSVDLSNLTTVGDYALDSTFSNCTSLVSMTFPKLTGLTGRNALYNIFGRCTSLISVSFPALTSTSFGSYTDQFNRMLYQVNGCTVHFPSNLQSIIGSWSDVVAGFGGTNTVILFDLPATT